MPVNRKLKIFLNYFLGPVAFLWVSFSFYKHLIRQPHLHEEWGRILDSLHGYGLLMYLVVLLLMLLNWGIEAKKWQLLVRALEPINFRKAFYSVLTGATIAVNTPNRVGEYGGRILYLKPENRLKAISLNMVTSVSQLIVTLLMGVVGVVYLLGVFSHGTLARHGLTPFWMDVLAYGCSAFCLITVILYFRLSWLARLLETVPALRRLKPYIAVLDHYEWPLLLQMLLLSALRFSVFVTQYFLMFRLLGVQVTWWQGFWAVSVLMLVLAVIPTITLTEPIIRGEAAIALLGLFNNNYLGVWAGSFVIWIINLIIPALLGSLLILGIKIIKD